MILTCTCGAEYVADEEFEMCPHSRGPAIIVTPKEYVTKAEFESRVKALEDRTPRG